MIVREHDAFSTTELQHLQSNSSRLAVLLGDDPASFRIRPAHDRGLLIHFTRSGLNHFRSHHWSWLLPFLEKAADDSCNAFVFELLIVPLGASKDRHRDISLIQPAVLPSHRPRKVSVLYVRIPSGAVGGELVVSPAWDEHSSEILVPSEGLMAHIKGDAYHQVQRLCSDAGDNRCEYGMGGLEAARISLVLEQYRLPRSADHWVPDFMVQPVESEKVLLSALTSVWGLGATLGDLYLVARNQFLSLRGSVASAHGEL